MSVGLASNIIVIHLGWLAHTATQQQTFLQVWHPRTLNLRTWTLWRSMRLWMWLMSCTS